METHSMSPEGRKCKLNYYTCRREAKIVELNIASVRGDYHTHGYGEAKWCTQQKRLACPQETRKPMSTHSSGNSTEVYYPVSRKANSSQFRQPSVHGCSEIERK
jgi:hypothetical protein